MIIKNDSQRVKPKPKPTSVCDLHMSYSAFSLPYADPVRTETPVILDGESDSASSAWEVSWERGLLSSTRFLYVPVYIDSLYLASPYYLCVNARMMIVEVRNFYIEAQLSVTDVISQRQMLIILISHCGWICQERNSNVTYAYGKGTLLSSHICLSCLGSEVIRFHGAEMKKWVDLLWTNQLP